MDLILDIDVICVELIVDMDVFGGEAYIKCGRFLCGTQSQLILHDTVLKKGFDGEI